MREVSFCNLNVLRPDPNFPVISFSDHDARIIREGIPQLECPYPVALRFNLGPTSFALSSMGLHQHTAQYHYGLQKGAIKIRNTIILRYYNALR